MKIDKGENPLAGADRILLVPTHEYGWFMSTIINPRHGGVHRIVGTAALLKGIENPEHIREINSGNREVLEQYLVPEDRKSCTYRFEDCHGELYTGAYGLLYAPSGPTMQEAMPFQPEEK